MLKMLNQKSKNDELKKTAKKQACKYDLYNAHVAIKSNQRKQEQNGCNSLQCQKLVLCRYNTKCCLEKIYKMFTIHF